MNVLICGDRHWTDFALISAELTALIDHGNRPVNVLEGGARGADRLAAEAVYQLRHAGFRVGHHRYPAEWDKHGRKAGSIRNQLMLTDGKPDLVLAFHDDLEHSKGTAHMVKIARKAGVEVRVITHKDTDPRRHPGAGGNEVTDLTSEAG